MKQLTELNSWILLEKHAQEIRPSNLYDFRSESDANNFKLSSQNIEIDYSHQRINQTTIELLLNLAKECSLTEKITALMGGEIVNQSQKIPALHTALRVMDEVPILVNGRDIIPDILAVRNKMHTISDQLRAGEWLGFSGKPITSIVNIGIGGSDFGPRLCINALSELTSDDLDYYFISDVDPKAFEETVKKLNPETTLFIIASKSFTTHETLYNARKALAWINSQPNLDKHFIAITANIKKAEEFGISNVLPIWDWVGGRYSFTSAINLITCIAIGYDAFIELLAGANSMDNHFRESDLHENMPVILALLGLWNINFLHIPSLLLLVYARQLELLVPYVQQLDMESNGKSIDNFGSVLNYATGPIVWGGIGNQAQHSYYQLLCQSTHKIAADFISTKEFNGEIINSFCNSKIHVLSRGITSPDNSNGYIQGGMPINHISIHSCSPFNLGALIALYEHKVYVQSVLWNINAFDQPGVESAKRLNRTSTKNLSYEH